MVKTAWPTDIETAKKIQASLRKKIRIVPLRKTPKTIAGVDAAFRGDTVVAAASLHSYPEMLPLGDAVCREKVRFPYVPGFLTFREGKAIINAVMKLDIQPDILLVDGQGIAHPRGIGIASHLGVLLNIPSVGCAKSWLFGTYEEPALEKGSRSHLTDEGKYIGAVVRTRTGVRPVFVSPGNLIDIATSVEIVLHCISKFRIPEPIRRADHIAGSYGNKERA